MDYISRFLKKLQAQGWLDKDKALEIDKLIRDAKGSPDAEILQRIAKVKLLTDGQIGQIQAQLEEEESSGMEMAPKATICYIKDVVKSYKTPEGIFQALRGITLSIYRGEILAILGFSGSGKSTLLNILGLLATPDTGSRIFYNGTSYAGLNIKERDLLRRKKFGFIFQESHLLGHLTTVENVALPLRLQNYSNSVCLERAKHILLNFMNKAEQENADIFFSKKPNQLSGGQKQRVAAARAMVHEPEIIFADEPTGNLDFDTGQMVMEILLKAAKEKGTTVVLVTHNPSQARQSCGRFIWMENGLLKKNLATAMDSTLRLMKQLSGKDLRTR